MEDSSDKIFNIAEASQFLHISKSMLRKLIYEKEINTFKIGNRYFFRKFDLQSWIDDKIIGGMCNEQRVR